MTKGPSLKARLIMYPLLGAFFVFVCYFIVLNAFGFNVYYRDGKIVKERTGTIILATRPGDANIMLDGQEYKSNTPGLPFLSVQIKRLSAGNHRIRLEKDGYETWDGSFEVRPGMVSWGTQVLLIPMQRKAQNFSLPQETESTLLSDDRKKLLVKMNDPENQILSFWEIDLATKESNKLFDKETLAGENLTPLYYSTNNGRILFERKTETNKTYEIIEARQNPSSWDINTTYNLTFDELIFNPKDQNELYAIREGSIYLLNYLEKKMSAVLDSNATDLFITNEKIYYIKSEGEKNQLFTYNASNPIKIFDKLTDSKTYQINYAGEEGGFAVLGKETKILSLYRATNDPYIQPITIANDVDWFNVSPKYQFIGYYANSSLYSYEIEKNLYFTTIKDVNISSLNWMSDQFNLIYSVEDRSMLVTYLGHYDTLLFNSEKRLPNFVSPNGDRVYFFSKNSETQKLDLWVYDFN